MPKTPDTVHNATMTPLHLVLVNANVHSVHLPDGTHVGNLKRVGALWKFKAIGYDETGGLIPGGGPLTDHHNAAFAEPEALTLVNWLPAPN